MGRNTITIDTTQIDRLATQLKGFEKEVAEAAYHAVSRAVDHVVKQIGRIVPQSYAIKATEVKASLKKKFPSKADLTASVTSTGHTLTMAHFPHTPTKPIKQPKTRGENRKYVRVQIKKATGKKYINTYPQPFVASTGANSADKVQYNVFRRSGKSRFPIEPIKTLSIPQMITNEGVAEKVQKAAQEKMEERLEHELTRLMTSMDQKIRR